MTKYEIVSLNYVNVGSKRAFFNFDTKHSSGNDISPGNVFVTEYADTKTQYKNLVQLSSTDGQYRIYPIYDIKDVSIKSAVDIFYQNKEIDAEDTYQNIYMPDMQEYPADFCQINTDSQAFTYMLSKPIGKDPYMYRSSLRTQRNTNDVITHYDMQLKSEDSELYLYKTPTDLGKSYKKFLQDGGDPLSIFTPGTIITGVNRNYVMEFPTSEIETDYDRGNIYSDFIVTKNHLNPLYSIEGSKTKLNKTRNYSGIGKNGNMVYLKYFSGYTINGDGTQTTPSLVPNQHIEVLNRNSFSNKCNHKSNLFSIKISDLESLSENKVFENDNTTIDESGIDHTTSKLTTRIRADLQAAIKGIVANVCPVNTQLFKVYFGN